MREYNLYGGNGFDDFFKINEYEWERFRKIEPKFESSYYGGDRIVWELPSGVNGNKIRVYLHMIINNISKIFPDNLWKYQYYLFERSDFEFSMNWDGDENGSINLAYKRPFGNSYVKGDVLESLLVGQRIDKENSYLSLNPDITYEEDGEEILKDESFENILYELYEVFKLAIEKWNWESIVYLVKLKSTWKEIDEAKKFIESEFSELELSKSLHCENIVFIPSLYDMRNETIDKLLKDE